MQRESRSRVDLLAIFVQGRTFFSCVLIFPPAFLPSLFSPLYFATAALSSHSPPASPSFLDSRLHSTTIHSSLDSHSSVSISPTPSTPQLINYIHSTAPCKEYLPFVADTPHCMSMPLLTTTTLEPSTPGAASDRTDYDPTRLDPTRLLSDPVAVASADRLSAPSSYDTPPTKYSYSLPVSTSTSASSTPNRKRSPSIVHRRNQSQGHITFPAFPLPSQQFPIQNPSSHIPDPPLSNAKLALSSMPIPPALGADQQQTKTMSSSIVERESYTLSDRTSTFVQTTGEIPPPLIGSTATIHKDRMFVFGGKRQGAAGPSNELYVLDLETLVWTLILETTELLGASSRPSVSAAGRFHPLSPLSHQPMQTNTTTARSIGKHASSTTTLVRRS